MGIKSNLNEILGYLPSGVKLIAVSKTKPIELIMEAYACGQRLFAENKAQELLHKKGLLPNDIEWHMIGHLQSNKVKLISSFVSLIHSVDSLKLLEVINREALKNNRIIHFLFQVYIAKEETKYGLTLSEVESIINGKEYASFTNVNLMGLMGMASFTEDINVIHSEFEDIKKSFNYLKDKYFSNKPDFCELSIGMSSDFKIAIEYGSTMIRIGSSIFGIR